MLPIRYTLWDVPFHTPLRADVDTVFQQMLDEDQMHMIFTPNPEIMLVSEENPEYKKVLKTADWNLPDGNGLLWASVFLEKTKKIKNMYLIILIFLQTYSYLLFNKKALQGVIPETVTGSGTFFQVHALFAKLKTPVFYFGGENGVEKKILTIMTERYPGLRAVGSCGGYPFRSPEENEMILTSIEKAAPQVLFVALTFPKQETWIMQNRERLERAGVRIAMGIGGTYDFAVGRIKRAPQWMQSMHIEWLWRMIQEPARMGRILRAVFYFPWVVLRKRLQD